MFDVKITGGLILDGTNEPAAREDIGICGDSIAAVGDLAAAPAQVSLEAGGKVICPGFIDVHSHSDTYILIEPSAPSKLHQGITTEVVGNCGTSAAPLYPPYRMPADWRDKPYPDSWQSVAEYRNLVAQARPAPNIALLIGHNTLRGGAMGYERRAPSAEEMRSMVARLERAMDEGGRGLSSGLAYPPGIFAARDEIAKLAAVAAARDGLYTTHMRSESRHLLEAVEEALCIARRSGAPLEISHLKASGRGNWGLARKALEHIREARAGGLDVTADRYPYTSSCTDLDIIFPDWFEEGGRPAVLARLHDAGARRRLREELLAEHNRNYWETITIGSTCHPDNRPFQGMPLVEMADRLGMAAVDAVLHLADTDQLKTSALFDSMNPENMLEILGQPFVMIGSDASLRRTEGVLSGDYPHPRAYGTCPRFIRMSIDGLTVPLAEAVRKMTSLPAERFRLKQRGYVRPGMKADIVVFDPVGIRDLATYADPRHYAQGIEHVFVNGVHTIRDGRLTGERGGLFL
jgi:N-acyl-D-amino-acid deacylase